MADPFGISFSPAGTNGPNGQAQAGSRPTPIQQAIQTLSLRIPRVAGASAFTAQPLLTSPGGGGLGGDPNSAAILERLRQMLFGSPASAPTGGDLGSAPNPMTSLGGMFGSPAMPAPTSGSGAPMGSGTESRTGAPSPNIFPGDTGGTGIGAPRSPEPPASSPLAPAVTPDPLGGARAPIERGDRGRI